MPPRRRAVSRLACGFRGSGRHVVPEEERAAGEEAEAKGMRTPFVISFLVHGTAVAALALLGVRAACPAPDRPFAVSIQPSDTSEIEPSPEEPALPEAASEPERWEFPDEAPTADGDEIEVSPVLGLGRSPPARAVRLSKPLPHRVPAPKVVAPPTVAAPAPARAAARVDPPRLLADLSPSARYPERARRLGLEGDVVLLLHIGTDGAVASVEIATSSGHEELDRAAADAARLWRFAPAREDGKAVAYDIRAPVEFRLTDA